MPLYYKFSEVIPLNLDNFLFLILVPLVPDPASELNLFAVTQLPYPLSANVTVSYGALAPYLGVSKDHELYTTLKEVDLQNCRKMSSLHFCNDVRPLYKSTSTSCLYALFTNLNVNTHCPKHVSQGLKQPLIVKDGPRWLYATNSDEYITIVCPQETRTLLLKIGVGALDIPSGCRVSSNFALLPVSQNFRQSKARRVNISLIEPFHLELSDPEVVILDKFKTDTLYQDILSLTGAPIPITSLKHELGSLREIQKMRYLASHTSTFAGITSVVIIAIFVITGGCCCWWLSVIKENRDRFGHPYQGDPGFLVRIRDHISRSITTHQERRYRATHTRTQTPQTNIRQARNRQSLASEEMLTSSEQLNDQFTDLIIAPHVTPRVTNNPVPGGARDRPSK